MTTHLRTLGAQAGAVLALVSGIVVLSASPAAAADPEVQISAPTTVESGKTFTLRYTVKNNNLPGTPGADSVEVSVDGLECRNGCGPAIAVKAGQTQSFSATMAAPTVGAGQERDFRVSVTVNVGPDSATAEQGVKVRGAQGPQSVRQVSGSVRDTKGKTVSGATVVVQDSTGRRFETQTNGDGQYSITSGNGKEIAVGALTIVAGKEGFKPGSASVQGGAGKTVNVQLTMAAVAESPSPSPSVSATESLPADEPTEEQTTAAAAPPTTPAAGDESSGSLLYIILGALLVAAGIGAIVLVLMRRKKNPEDDLDGPVPPGRAGVGFGDQTRVAAPVGARGNDATMIAGAGAMGDAPTVLQRAVPADDEFPDPYGAPAQAGYGQQTQMYGGAQVPAQGSGYDDGYYDDGAADRNYYGGQQPQQQRYDEPTGMYGQSPYADGGQQQPSPSQTQSWDDGSGYAAGGGYGSNAAGYDQGGAGYDQAGYDQHGGYQAPQQQGYDQPQQGYDQRGGYDDNDYGQQRGGYDQGYYDDGRGTPPRR